MSPDLPLMYIREGCRKKIRKKCGLLPNQGGVSEGKQKTKPQVWGLKKGQKWPKMA